MKRLVPLAEAHVQLGLGYSTLRGLIASGVIPAVRIGKRKLYVREDVLDAFVRRAEISTAALRARQPARSAIRIPAENR